VSVPWRSNLKVAGVIFVMGSLRQANAKRWSGLESGFFCDLRFSVAKNVVDHGVFVMFWESDVGVMVLFR
jgi:hypothetical protein